MQGAWRSTGREVTERVVLPRDLIPSDGRFGSGPSKVHQAGIDALAMRAPTFLGTSHRRDGVKSVVGRIREGLGEFFGLPDGYEVLLGNGGATAFWDAAAFGLIERRSQHMVFGEFSSKFAKVAAGAPHLDAPEVIEAPVGSHPLPIAHEGIDAYALCQNETSTGVMMPIFRPEGADSGALVLVDATSAAGGIRVEPNDCDVYYFSPQKCFGSDGGLWLAFASPAAIERIAKIASAGRWAPPSLSLPIALENSRLNQTYNTPALATLFLLAEQIGWMLEIGGLKGCAARCDDSANTVYGWADAHSLASPFVADPAMRSPVTATIDFDESVDASGICAALRANGIVDTEPYRNLGRNQIRLALFPGIEPGDVEIVTRAIDYLIEALPAK